MLQTARTRQVLLLCAVLFVLTFGFLISHNHERIKDTYHEYTRPNTNTNTNTTPPPPPPPPSAPSSPAPEKQNTETANKPSTLTPRPRTDKLHVLLPASNPEVNLCKTLLTSAILDYPIPTLIAWNEDFDKHYLLGSGSHVAKITRVLEWMNAQDASADDDLVIMMDAYDIWWQLRPEVLIDRYYAINDAANARIQERMGRAADIEGIEQTIIFGAGKRCAPNQVHTVACYPIPESPLPDDVYGANTDTVMGRNKYTSLRQRYLNSGYAIGPMKEMRAMFERAREKVEAMKDQEDFDNGSHGSDFMYHGSDQSIFNIMLGEQEFQREVMRRRHLTDEERAAGKEKANPTYIEGTLVDDPINPSFTHEEMKHKEGKPDEFGIGLDYFSDLGQQTVNAEDDAGYMVYGRDIEEQVPFRHMFDCPSRVKGELPKEVTDNPDPYALEASNEHIPWTDVPLYTNVCLDRIPVMIHHNGVKEAREYAWTLTWMQPHARKIMESIVNGTSPEGSSEEKKGGAHLPDGQYLSWGELCPFEYEHEIFRDVEPLPKPGR